jgi:hypothetical protein
MHGRKPTPEELEKSRQAALKVLDELSMTLDAHQIATADSERIHQELGV